MSLTLPSHLALPTSTARHNTAIAQVVLWSLIWITGISIRTIQEWRYWNHRHPRKAIRCYFFAWWRNLVVLLAQIRVVGFVLFLVNDGKKDVDRSLVVTEVVLQGVGVSPLTLELSLVLIKCGRVGLTDRKATRYTAPVVKTLLEWTRLPIVAAVVLIIVAGCILNTSLLKAGSIVILVAFMYLLGILAYLFLSGGFASLPRESQKAILMVAAALPFYIIRFVYMLLADFGEETFSPALGDWRVGVGMQFLTEICIVVLLVGATLIVEPVWGSSSRLGAAATEDGELEAIHDTAVAKNESGVQSRKHSK